MNDLKWLDEAERMLKEPWFEFNFRGARLRLEQTTSAGARYSQVSGGSFQYDIPLPIHAAWVLARAEEEMAKSRVFIVQLYPIEPSQWGIRDESTGGWLLENPSCARRFPSRPAAVLAAYEYLYPINLTPEQIKEGVDDVAGQIREKYNREAAAPEKKPLDNPLRDTIRRYAGADDMDERVGRLEMIVDAICQAISNGLPDGAMYAVAQEVENYRDFFKTRDK